MKEYTVNELGSVLACLNELYDKVRVVEPDTGCLCNAENGFAATSCTCNDEGRCLNCVGYQAVQHNAPTFKLQSENEKAYAVTAIPFRLEDRTLVLETWVDITGQAADWGHQADAMMRLVDQEQSNQVRDFLTGVYNRQYVEGYFAPRLPQMRKDGKTVLAVVVDVRHFKELGARYGAGVADQVLCYVPNWFRRCNMTDRFVARFHSDQFLLVSFVQGETLEKIRREAKDMYDEIGGSCVCGALNNKRVPVQLAMAAADLNETANGTWNELKELLFARLAEAKQADDEQVH